jgi:hypothetical protein
VLLFPTEADTSRRGSTFSYYVKANGADRLKTFANTNLHSHRGLKFIWLFGRYRAHGWFSNDQPVIINTSSIVKVLLQLQLLFRAHNTRSLLLVALHRTNSPIRTYLYFDLRLNMFALCSSYLSSCDENGKDSESADKYRRIFCL